MFIYNLHVHYFRKYIMITFFQMMMNVPCLTSVQLESVTVQTPLAHMSVIAMMGTDLIPTIDSLVSVSDLD